MNSQRSETTKHQQLNRLKRGEWIGIEPFGYTRDFENFNPGENRPIIVDPVAAACVKDIFNMYCNQRLSIRSIQEKIPQLYPFPLSRCAVNRILTNEFYCGTMTVKGIPYPHNYEQLIDKETFNHTQAIMKLKQTRHKGALKKGTERKPFLYRSLLTCSICLCGMSPTLQKNAYVYYGCTLARVRHPRKYISEKSITAQLMALILNLPDGNEIWQIYELSKLENQHIILRYLFTEMKVDTNNVLEFIRNENANLEGLKNILTGTRERIIVSPDIIPIREGNLVESVLAFCKKPTSLDAILAYMKKPLAEVQSLLFDLQLQDQIEEIEMGVWKSKE